MQNAETVLNVLRERGRRGLPCTELYRQLFNPSLYELAHGRIYANHGAMTPGADGETADGMSPARTGRIIDALRHERYRFQPVKRVYIPKKSGKLRPLGLPSWPDKIVGEVIRLLLEAYYEPRFSGRSHGFRPGRGCHTALREVEDVWSGTTWFIEGDISDCFGSLDHEIMVSILAEKIHDNRFLRLVRNMLAAGYLEDWNYHPAPSGCPQGGVVSPVLSNIYLDRLDKFTETVLIPEYTRGAVRTANPEYGKVTRAIGNAVRRGERPAVRRLRILRRGIARGDPRDSRYRRLRYIRYADLCRGRHKSAPGYPFNRSNLGPVDQLSAGRHYPRSAGEFQSWFGTDADCLDYLEWLRWPDGFACPACGGSGWQLGDGRFECAGCGRRTSVTAGTIFDRTRTPLTVWFTACWLFATQKDGVSAQSLQRALDIGSYQTAWAMLGRLRSVLVRPGRDLLAGTVEVDETFIGGEEPGLRGGRARGKKSLVGIAVEVREPKGIGRCRMAVLPDASAAALRPFITGHIEPGTRVITDAWQGYHGLDTLGYTHERRSQRAARTRGEDPGELLPAVHRIASLAKRWLLGTHQGSVDPAHLASYLDEFVFRFNRRRSASRGLVFCRLLQLAAAHDPVRYRDLVASQLRLRAPSAPPRSRGRPPSLERPPAGRPWRGRDLESSG